MSGVPLSPMRSTVWSMALGFVLMAFGLSESQAGSRTDGITFAAKPAQVFVPIHEAESQLALDVERAENGGVESINGVPLKPGDRAGLVDGTELISVAALGRLGVALISEADGQSFVLSTGWWRKMRVQVGAQRVEVSLAEQRLRGWQGDRLVLETKISSGRNGRTPKGEFVAGPYKAAMHRSSLYNDAPMPWSVQINGNIFVHGFTSVPDYPASHGCIRMPLDGGNPAKWFYEWVSRGTPVVVK